MWGRFGIAYFSFAYNSVERDTDGLMSAGLSTIIGKEICFTRL